jgi:hypothetical protein
MALSKVNPNFVEQTPYGRRNLIINGAMQVAQRGSTSVTGITNNGAHFLVDRFKTVINSAFTTNIEQSTDAPDGFINSLKYTVTTATSPGSGDYFVIDTNLEKQNLYSTGNGTSWAKSITISFWVKSSITGNFAVALQNYGSSRRSNVLSYTINSANTWEYKTVSTTADTTTNTNSANGSGLGLRFALGAGSSYKASNATSGWTTSDTFSFTGAASPAETTNATWQITGIQLEVGDTATPFEHHSYGEELSLCQRYCYVFTQASGEYGGLITAANAYTTTSMQGGRALPVTMRAKPTLSFTGNIQLSEGSGVVNSSATSVVGNGSSINQIHFWCGNFSGLTQHRNYFGNMQTAGDTFTASAEL